ncbi:MAG: DnaD domain protein [Selenomonas sp.]|nr:DnaD domain protein [Selenomonas sp.]
MIAQLTAFGRISIDNLSATAQALYLRLILIDNGLGWPERFYASNSRLMTEAGINSEKTLITARNQLIQMGLVEYRKGTAKGKASTYKLNIIPTTGVTTVGTTVGTTVASAGVSGAYMTDQYRQEKTRQEKTIAAAATRAREEDNALAEVVRVFEENIHPLGGNIESDTLIDLVDDYSAPWVIAAVKEAVIYNARSMGYMKSILKRWKRDGFKPPRKGGEQHGAGRNDSREALEERYQDYLEADRNHVYPWEVQPDSGGDRAASGGDRGN